MNSGAATFRASGGKDDAIRLTPPKRMPLEQALAYIDEDELVEAEGPIADSSTWPAGNLMRWSYAC